MPASVNQDISTTHYAGFVLHAQMIGFATVWGLWVLISYICGAARQAMPQQDSLKLFFLHWWFHLCHHFPKGIPLICRWQCKATLLEGLQVLSAIEFPSHPRSQGKNWRCKSSEGATDWQKSGWMTLQFEPLRFVLTLTEDQGFDICMSILLLGCLCLVFMPSNSSNGKRFGSQHSAPVFKIFHSKKRKRPCTFHGSSRPIIATAQDGRTFLSFHALVVSVSPGPWVIGWGGNSWHVGWPDHLGNDCRSPIARMKREAGFAGKPGYKSTHFKHCVKYIACNLMTHPYTSAFIMVDT